MTLRRHRFASLFAGIFLIPAVSCLPRASAQEPVDAPAPSAEPAPAETPEIPVTPAATPEQTPVTKPAAPAESLSVNGGYGFVPQTFVPGEGRLAKPKLRFSVSISQGYDNNIFGVSGKTQQAATTGTDNGTSQSPQNTTGVGVPTGPVTVFDLNGNPIVFFPVHPAHGNAATPQSQIIYVTTIDGTVIGYIPVNGILTPVTTGTATPRTTQQPTVRPVPPRGIEGSATTNVNLHADLQFATPRTVMALDLNLGALFYSNPDEPLQENASLSLVYIHKISGRMQLNAQINAAYGNQPNFSQANAPTQSNTGSYINGTTRLDLSYQVTARLQAEATYTIQTQLYVDLASQSGDFIEQTFGEQLRYTLTPRTTLATEYRYSFSTYKTKLRNNSSNYLLLGFDLNLSRRMAASLRFGEQVQTAEIAAQASKSPYFESTLSYLYGGGASRLSWTSRYGFEQSQAAASNNLTFRTGLGINQALTARIQASLGVNYLHTTQSTLGGAPTESRDDIDFSLSVSYVYNPKLSFSGNLSHIQVLSTNPLQTYSRDRVSIGTTYAF